jgi:hypothetical protein
MIIGTFGTPPSYGGSASANNYSSVEELLNKMPDNTANLIQAKDVRDSVYSLWEKISDVQTVASQSASASSYYTNLSPSVASDLSGIPAGSTFSAATMQEMWDKLLYPYVYPYAALSGGDTREFGSSNVVNLSWTATKNTKTLTFITLKKNAGTIQNVVVTGNTQTGTFATTAVTNTDTTFSIEVVDNNTPTPSTVTAYTYVYWSNAVYWGKTSTFALPSMTIVGSKPAWADGAGIGVGKNIYNSGSRAGSYNGINGTGQYLVFAWPSSYGTPTFTINGLPNTAWTKIGTSISFTNMNSYVNTYDVWISNTAQNSPITSFVIS